jgi:pyrophosphatase PpaX
MAYQLQIYRDHLKLCPGVAEALECLQGRKKGCAVVTSRMPETLTVYLRETGILGFFNELITPRSTERHKPDPEPALEALRRMGGTPGRTLFIGDSLFDMECGSRAGTSTAFVEWSHNKAEALGMTPDYILSDMRDICGW